jgi:hypothetical protein
MAPKDKPVQTTVPMQELKRKIIKNLSIQRKVEYLPFDPITDNINVILSKKLLDNLRNENNWKDRIEAT